MTARQTQYIENFSWVPLASAQLAQKRNFVKYWCLNVLNDTKLSVHAADGPKNFPCGKLQLKGLLDPVTEVPLPYCPSSIQIVPFLIWKLYIAALFWSLKAEKDTFLEKQKLN